MKLREYQAKRIFADRGIRIPEGEIALSPDEAAEVAARLGGPVVLKPQLGVKGRGKVGGIGFADDPAGAKSVAARLFAAEIKGEKVERILVERRMPFSAELYAAVAVDFGARGPVLIASADGGVDIEEVARETPGRVLRIPVNILRGPTREDLRPVAEQLGEDFAHHLEILYEVFRDYDAEIVEVNPMARGNSGGLIALDAVLNVNEDSVARHPELLALKEEHPAGDPFAEEAAAKSWTYIELDGDIGILSSGAGLTMAILDLIHGAGGGAANFLDTAQIEEEGIYDAFGLLARAGRSQVLLVNIFAGLNRCDSLAAGIVRYLQDHDVKAPVVVRMIGNQEEEGHRMLREAGIEPFTDLEGAIERAVELSKQVPQ